MAICATLLLATASRAQPATPAPDENDSPIAAAPIAPAPVAPAPASAIAAQNEKNLRAEIALLKSQLAGAAQKNTAAAAQLNAAIATLKTENAALRDDIQKRDDERGALIQKLAAAQLALQKKAEAADTSAAVTAELTKARLNIDSLTTQIQNLTGENQRLAAQIDEAATRAAQAAAELKTITAERDKALAQTAATATDATDATATALAGMTKERDTLAKRLATLEAQTAADTASAQADKERLREKIAAVGNTLTAMRLAEQTNRDQLEKAQKAQADAEARATDLANQLAGAKQQLADAESQLSLAKDSQPLYEKMLAQLSQTRDALRQAQEQAARLAAENTRLKERPAAVASVSTGTTGAVATAIATSGSASANTEQTQPQPQPQTHTVAPGETLSTISRRYYGTVAYWQDIYDANRDQLATPEALKPGMKLRIP